MSKMFRHADAASDALPPGDAQTALYVRGRQEWDERMGDAIARERTWKRMFVLSLLVLAGSVAGNVWQGTQSKIQPMTVVRDGAGDIVGVRAAEVAERPDPAYIAADVKRWVRNVRTIYTDTKALKTGILEVYAMTGKQGAASEMLSQHYRSADPFERAKKETASVSAQSALPISDGDAEGRHTWRTEWTETTVARDGTVISRDQWQATITFVITPPSTAAEVQNNPSGLYVVNYSWTKRGA